MKRMNLINPAGRLSQAHLPLRHVKKVTHVVRTTE